LLHYLSEGEYGKFASEFVEFFFTFESFRNIASEIALDAVYQEFPFESRNRSSRIFNIVANHLKSRHRFKIGRSLQISGICVPVFKTLFGNPFIVNVDVRVVLSSWSDIGVNSKLAVGML
jgi:hypothetical protein